MSRWSHNDPLRKSTQLIIGKSLAQQGGGNPEGSEQLTKHHLDGSRPQASRYLRKILGYYRDIGVGCCMFHFPLTAPCRSGLA